MWVATIGAQAQCTWYTITMEDSPTAFEVSWTLIDELGVTWASGVAPWEEDVCLPDGCYTLLMYDSGGNGWQSEDWVIEDWSGDFDFDTNLGDGPHGTDTFVLGEDQPCDPATPGCPAGTAPFQFIVTSGVQPGDVTWDLALNGTVLYAGGAPYDDTLCLADACYWLHLFDANGNGWNGAGYTLKLFGGATLYTGTLMAGSVDSVQVVIGAVDCNVQPPPGGGDCSNGSDPTGDCPTAVCVCDPYTFPITPSGFGAINEIPAPGSFSNPSFGGGIPPPPWGGTDYGCLLAAELNSSWMLFNIGTSGSLGFSFGGGGQQVGYYDWSMWLYTGPGTCNAITSNTLAPVRCLWNAVSWGGTGMANTLPPGANAGNYAPELMVTAGQQYIICMSNWSYMTMNVTLDFFGTATVQCGLVLPIELLDFHAVATTDEVLLDWTTATERNSDYFNVERSSNGLDYALVGTVPAAGTSQTLQAYALVDADPLPGLSYYRLTEYDLDGTQGAREVRAVHFSDAGSGLQVLADPAGGIWWVTIPSGEDGTLSVIDMAGRTVVQRPYLGVSERTQIGLSMVALPEGVYLILAVEPGRALSTRRFLTR